MLYSQEIYQLQPEHIKDFNNYFNEFIYPVKCKNGAKLIGRWAASARNEIIEIWEYPSYEEYLKIEERVKKDKPYECIQEQVQNIDELFLKSSKDFLTRTGTYSSPKQSVSVSGYITNNSGETLLVKTYWRPDTWELPGGGVDEGETLDEALKREIFEETGIVAELKGVTGVYSNGSTVSIVFCGKAIGGKLSTSEETQDVQFVKLTPDNLSNLVKRAKFIPRVRDAMKSKYIPYEAFKVRPYELLRRIEADSE